MIFSVRAPTGLSPRGWKRAAGLALLLAACDPTTPVPSECGDVPPCSAYDYHVDAPGLETDSATGAHLMATSGWSAYFSPDPSVPALARQAAIATSCIPCAGYASVDSAFFTTDLVSLTNDTLKAGTNLVGRALLVGLHVSGPSVTVQKLTLSPPTIRFRDSLFELRFSGMIDSVRKSATAKFRVADTALLLR